MKTIVSVCMITYNQANYVKASLDSILNQSISDNFKIVIGDDCSTDGTVEILTDYKKKYSNLIDLKLNKKNQGMMLNFSDTLLRCNGEYIALLEGDDYWISKNKLQKQIDFLEKNPEYVISFHNAKVVDHVTENKLFFSKAPGDTFGYKDLLNAPFFPTCTVVFRNNLIKNFPNWFMKTPVGDWPLFLLLSKYGKLKYQEGILGARRIHSGGLWGHRSKVKQLVDLESVLHYFKGYFETDHQLYKSISSFNSRIAYLYFKDRSFIPYVYFRLKSLYFSLLAK